jgi:hypothetical protein
VAEQAAVLVRDTTATVDDLRPFLRGVSAAQGLTLASPRGGGSDTGDRELIYRALMELRVELRDVKEVLGRLVGGAASLPASLPAVPVRFDAEHGPAFSEEADGFAFVPDEPPPFRNEHGPDYDDHVEDAAYEIEEEADERAQEREPDDEAAGDVPGPAAGSALRLGQGPLPTMEEAEQSLIAEALRRFDGNRRQTAKALGISERTLYRKIKDLEEQGVEV